MTEEGNSVCNTVSNKNKRQYKDEKKQTNMVIYEQDTEINLTGVQYFANILLFT